MQFFSSSTKWRWMETLASRICTLGKKCSLIPLQKWPWLASWVAPRSHTRLGEGLPRKWWTDGHLARILKDGSIYDTFRCIFYAAHGFHVIYRLDFKSWGFRILNPENLNNANFSGFQDSKSSGYRILYPQGSISSGFRILESQNHDVESPKKLKVPNYFGSR